MEKEEQKTEVPPTEEISESKPSQPKSKYADYVTPDGRTWDQLSANEKKKIKKKLNKKNKAKAAPVPDVENMDFSVDAQIEWTLRQIKLGLTSKDVTKDQCKVFSF